MCKCQDENNKPCSCSWKKWALIGIGLVVIAGIGYWYWKHKQQAVAV